MTGRSWFVTGGERLFEKACVRWAVCPVDSFRWVVSAVPQCVQSAVCAREGQSGSHHPCKQLGMVVCCCKCGGVLAELLPPSGQAGWPIEWLMLPLPQPARPSQASARYDAGITRLPDLSKRAAAGYAGPHRQAQGQNVMLGRAWAEGRWVASARIPASGDGQPSHDAFPRCLF
eukprot:160153-Chlamydomonas_euryale.AAC.1